MTMTDEAPTAAPAPAEETTEEAKGKGKKNKKGKKDKGGKSNLVPAVVLAFGIAAGGYFMGGSSGEAAVVTETTLAPEVVEGPLLAIESLTLNLGGGHYLRVGVSFQMTDAYEDAVEGEHGEAEFGHHDASRVQDMLIALFGGREAGPLTTAEGRGAAKDDLLVRANELFDGAVMDVYLTEFVIQ